MAHRFIRLLLTIITFFSLAIISISWKMFQKSNVFYVNTREYHFAGLIMEVENGQWSTGAEKNCSYDSIKEYTEGFLPYMDINCSRLMRTDRNEIMRVKKSLSIRRKSLSEGVIKKVQNCSWLRNYVENKFYNSDLERNFPLGYVLVVHDSPEQVLRLIRVLYRKQNSFCIHCDFKSPYRMFFQSIATCLDNVVVPLNLTRVVWGHSSILEAQLKCMKELVKLREQQEYKWKYLIQLCGKELPLATNREIVEQLIKFNGTSNILAYKITANHSEFYSRIMHPVLLVKNNTEIRVDKSKRLRDPPFNHSLYYYKSSGYHALSFQFVHHLLYNTTAIAVYKFFYSCKNPEEHFYASIFMMPGVPGGYNPSKRYFSIDNVFWVPPHRCSGKIVHRVCIVGVEDLARVVRYGRGHFFHNKYFMEYDDCVMYCMEKTLVDRNKKEYDIECGQLL